jgi:hypothetical protein
VIQSYLLRDAALGVMDRLVLSEAQWARISGLIIGRPDQCGPTGSDNQGNIYSGSEKVRAEGVSFHKQFDAV